MRYQQCTKFDQSCHINTQTQRQGMIDQINLWGRVLDIAFLSRILMIIDNIKV